MILYNMRNRGPFEYDKFVLNILQLYNAINLAEINELKITNDQVKSLIEIKDTINTYYTDLLKLSNEINKKIKLLK